MLIDKISFLHFRGLPSNTIDFGGKNTLIIGGNGKGKSSIVDGLELFFSSNIDGSREPSSYRHIKSSNEPSIVIYPQNSSQVTCTVDPSAGLVWNPQNKGDLEKHPLPRNFILRRNKIISLIESNPSDRFRYIMELLGEDEIGEQRKKFQEAAKDLKDRCEAIQQRIQSKYRILVNGFIPKNLSEVIEYTNKLLTDISIEKIDKTDGLELVRQEIEKKLSFQDVDFYAKITNAVESLKMLFNDKLQESFDKYSKILKEVVTLTQAFKDGNKSAIIDNAIIYFEQNSNEQECPICGQEISPTGLLLQLKNRRQILSKLSDALSAKKSTVQQVVYTLDSHVSQLRRELELCKQFMSSELQASYVQAINSFSNMLKNIRDDVPVDTKDNTLMLVSYTTLFNERVKLLALLEDKQKNMLATHDVKIKIAFDHISSFLQVLPEIESLNSEYLKQIEIYKAVEAARVTIEKACTDGLLSFLDSFVVEISQIYNEFHNFSEDGAEISECTKIELTPTRGRSPLMHLKIDFFDKTTSVDPNFYLSEGHLDSLGLSIFLASVLKFNPKGSLVVLDDVLTSIDSSHKHRVASMLTSKFLDYQLIITTHDEAWARDVLRFAESYSARNKWKSIHVSKWDIDFGPYLDDFKELAARVLTIDEENYVDRGATLRQLSESFMTEFVAGMQMLIPFAYGNRLTVENILVDAKVNPKNRKTKEVMKYSKSHSLDEPNNIARLLCNSLQCDFDGSNLMSQEEAQKLVGMIFITVGDTLNILSHWKPLSEVPFARIKDFIASVIKVRSECEKKGLIKKFQWQ